MFSGQCSAVPNASYLGNIICHMRVEIGDLTSNGYVAAVVDEMHCFRQRLSIVLFFGALKEDYALCCIVGNNRESSTDA
jgi:hypothetical protein